MMEQHVLVGGEVLWNVHPDRECFPEACCIHNPSNHHMVDWPQHYSHETMVMFRMCEHGQYHPDPDDGLFRPDRHYNDRIFVRLHQKDCDQCCNPLTNLKIEDVIADLQRIQKDLER